MMFQGNSSLLWQSCRARQRNLWIELGSFWITKLQCICFAALLQKTDGSEGSWPLHCLAASGQLHAPLCLCIQWMSPWYPLDKAGWVPELISKVWRTVCCPWQEEARGSSVVKTLDYKRGGRGFETRWGEILKIYLILPAALGPVVHSTSNRNEYRKH
jgi:hypothetical protein